MGSRVYLRALELDDSVSIHKWRSDSNINKYLAGNVFFVSSEREKKSTENKIYDDSKSIYLGVCLKESNKLIGYVNVNNIDMRNLKAEWGGTLIGEYQLLGKGYGEEASKLLLRFLFDQYPLNKCYAYCLASHPSTISLFKKLGFIRDGVLRQDVFKNGEFHDLLLFSILRAEINNHF